MRSPERKLSILLAIALGGAGASVPISVRLISDALKPKSLAQASEIIPATATSTSTSIAPTKTAILKAEFTVVPIDTATATATSNPTPTEVPATPTPKTGYENTAQGIIFRTEKGEILNVPQIEGLKTELVTKSGKQKIEYNFLEDNKFGVEAGSYAGECVINVRQSLEEGNSKLSGGLVLVPSVVNKLIQDKLDSMSGTEQRVIIAIPADIRTVNPEKEVRLGIEIGGMGTPMLKITYVGEIQVPNILPDTKELRISGGGNYGLSYYNPILMLNSYGEKIKAGEEMKYIWVSTRYKDNVPPASTIKKVFGDKVGVSETPIFVSFASSTEGRAITIDKILILNGWPVFLAANDYNNEFKVLADGSINYGRGVIGPSKADQ